MRQLIFVLLTLPFALFAGTPDQYRQSGIPAANGAVNINPTTNAAATDVIFGSSVNTNKALVVQGKAGQSVNLVEVQDSTGAVLTAFGGAPTSGYMQMSNGASAAVSSANTGRIIYNSATQRFQVSENGGAYYSFESLTGFTTATNTGLGVGAGTSISTASGNTVVGVNAGTALTTTANGNNVFMGALAGDAVTTATSNVAVGHSALSAAAGNQNTAIGTNALLVNTAAGNTAVGYNAGVANTSGIQNTFLGTSTGTSSITGSDNTYVGFSAGDGGGSRNTVLGSSAGGGSVSTNDTTLIGHLAGQSNTTGQVTMIGSGAGAASSSGNGLTYVGYYAGVNATGSSNTLIGHSSAQSMLNGSRNTSVGQRSGGASNVNDGVFIGYESGQGITGVSNTVVGAGSASTLTSGTGNIILGAGTDVSAAGTANSFVAGSNSYPITNVYFGKGMTNGAATAYTINGTGGSGSNNNGGALQLAGGKGNGTGVGGNIVFQTAPVGGSGSTPNALVTRGAWTYDGALDWTGIATVSQPALSSAGSGRIYFDSTTNTFLASQNGGAYAPFGGGGGVTTASLPLIVSGSNVALGTATGPTTADVNSSATWSPSGAASKALVLQGKASQSAAMFQIQDSTGTAHNEIRIGSATYSGVSNTNLGLSAGQALTSGSYNVFSGSLAGDAITTASNNVAVGALALSAVAGNQNTAVGSNALYSNTADGNTALGYKAGYLNGPTVRNTFIGWTAGENLGFTAPFPPQPSADDNTLVGNAAGSYSGYMNRSTIVGSMPSNTASADDMTAIGYTAGLGNTGEGNVFVGSRAGYNNSYFTGLTLVGFKSGENVNGARNTVIGALAAPVLTSGSENTIVGSGAGQTLITGQGNILLGQSTGTDTSAASNNFVAGSSSQAITNVYFGRGMTNSSASSYPYTINGTGGSGANNNGGTLQLAGGRATGSGTPAEVVIRYPQIGASSSTLQTLSTYTNPINTSLFTGPVSADTTHAANSSLNAMITSRTGHTLHDGGIYRVGETIHLRAGGLLTTAASPDTFDIEITTGGAVLIDTGAITPPANLANAVWTLDLLIQVRTLGATGTVSCSGTFTVCTSSGFAAPSTYPLTSNDVVIDTTAANAIEPFIRWNASNGGNSFTTRVFQANRSR